MRKLTLDMWCERCKEVSSTGLWVDDNASNLVLIVIMINDINDCLLEPCRWCGSSTLYIHKIRIEDERK
jgi:hypothetical protein